MAAMDEKPTNGKRRLTAEEQAQFDSGLRKAELLHAQITALAAKKSMSDADMDKTTRLNEEIQKVLDSIKHLAHFAE